MFHHGIRRDYLALSGSAVEAIEHLTQELHDHNTVLVFVHHVDDLSHVPFRRCIAGMRAVHMRVVPPNCRSLEFSGLKRAGLVDAQ
jgi:hypothetical protein